MKRSVFAIFINALTVFCFSGAAQAHVNLQLISAGGASGAQLFLERMTSEPASIALLGAGLLVIGGAIRRRRSKGNTGSRKRSLDEALDTGD
jgi:hypothetical protein